MMPSGVCRTVPEITIWATFVAAGSLTARAPAIVAKPAIISTPKPAIVSTPKPAMVSAPKPAPQETARPAVSRESSHLVGASPVVKPKERRQTESFQKRLWMNIGEEMGIVASDIVNTISGETGLSGGIVGAVDIRERHLFVDVAAEHANGIIAKLKRTQIKGHKIKVKAA